MSDDSLRKAIDKARKKSLYEDDQDRPAPEGEDYTAEEEAEAMKEIEETIKKAKK